MKALIRNALLIVAVTTLCLDAVAYGDSIRVGLQSDLSEKYVRIEGTKLKAISQNRHDAERFEIISLETDDNLVIALRASNGKYLEVDKYGWLRAVGTRITDRAKFHWYTLSDHRTHALWSVYQRKYVRAGVGKGSQLAAVSDHIRGWERFHFACR